MASHTHIVRGAGVGLLLIAGWAGCGGNDSDPQAEDGSTSGPDSDTMSVTSSPPTSSTTGPIDCVPGQETCPCLNADCVGSLECVEDICVPGPELDVDEEDRDILAGLRVPIEADIIADSFAWEQVSGPPAELQGSDTPQLLVDLPVDAAPGETVTLRLNAVRNTIERSIEVRLNIIDAVFEDALPKIDDPAQLGTTEGFDIGQGSMWVVSTEGFVSRFGAAGNFMSSTSLGNPVGGRLGRLPQGDDQDAIDVFYIADSGGAVLALSVFGENLELITDQTDGGAALGTVNFVLQDGNGDLFFSNRGGGQIFHHDIEEGITRVFLDGMRNPNALSLGPEAGVLYIGAVGQIWRVPILQGDDGITAGDRTLYLELGPEDDPTLEVDGIAFDEGYSMWVGTPGTSTLHVVRYVAGQAEVTRSWSDVGANISGFVNPRFGRNDFEGRAMYWTNLAGGTVGRLYTGVGSID
jgi:sugar lactone lactonase YvrE